MNKKIFEEWEIRLLVEYFEEFVQAIIYNKQSDSIEAAMDLNRKRDALIEHLKIEFGIEE